MPGQLKSIRWKRHHLEYKETIVTILCEEQYVRIAWQAIQEARNQLECYIVNCPAFESSHQSLALLEEMPEPVRRMIAASAQVGVGPMAAVAGTLAWLGVEAVQAAGADEVIIDNGGDIALLIKNPVTVGVFAGNHFKSLAMDIEPRDSIFGICTSLGTIGPSYSYGTSDAAIVISENVALADAAATALGNRVQNFQLNHVFDFMQDNYDIEGAAVVVGDQLALWGNLPEIVNTEVDPDLITKGRIR